MYTNADCTIYKYSPTGYNRIQIHDIFWSDVKQKNVLKSGLTSADSIRLIIPISSVNNLTFTPQKDIVVKGLPDFEIDNTSAKTISDGLTHITNVLDGHSVSSVADNRYGSPAMQHYDLSLK